MNMNLDDPKLTAYALDELDEPEKSTVARAVADSPEAQQIVNETREMAGLLKSEYAAELEKETRVPSNLTDIHDDPWFWKIARPLSIAAANSSRRNRCGFSGFLALQADTIAQGGRSNLPPPGPPPAEIDAETLLMPHRR